MIKKIVNLFICGWVAGVEKHAWRVLAALTLATVLALYYSVIHFSINSDLDRLVRPSRQIEWYGYDRTFRSTFPQFQEFALVVVSGDSAEDTFGAAESLYKAFRDSRQFDDVFSPEFEPFVTEHILYNAPAEIVKRVSEKVEENLPGLEELYRVPSVANLAAHLETMVARSAEEGVLLPDARQALRAYVATVNRPDGEDAPPLRLVKNFVPEEQEGVSYHFITLKRHLDYSEKQPNAITIAAIREVIRQVPVRQGVQVRVTGEVAMLNEDISAGLSGIQASLALSLFLSAIIVIVGIRTPLLLGGIFLMLLSGIALTTSFALFALGSFNTLSLVFLVMFFGLGVDYAVHFSLAVVEAQQACRQGLEISQVSSPALKAASETGGAMGLCALTSVAGFMGFFPTDYIGLAELGFVSAAGIIIAYVLSLTFFPAWFKVFGNEALLRQGPSVSLKHFSHLLKLPPRQALAGSLLVTILAVWYAHDVRFNFSHLAMRDKKSEAMSTLLELQKRKLGTEYSISIIAEPHRDLVALKEALLKLPTVAKVTLPQDYIPLFQDAKQQYMQPLARRLSALGEAGKVTVVDSRQTPGSLQGLMAAIDENKEAFLDDDQRLVMEARDATEKLLADPAQWASLQQAVAVGVQDDVELLRLWFSAKPYGLHELPPALHDRLVTPKGGLLVNVIPAVDMADPKMLEKFIQEVRTVAPNYTGRGVVEWGVGKIVLDAFLEAATIAVVAIFLLLLLHFRRITTSVLVFLPLLLATLLTFVVMKAFGLTLNMANILVVPLIYGLGVDTGIYVVHRYHHCRSLEEMMLSGTTKAVVISALTTMSTFISLSFSPHKGAASVGLLLAIAISLLLLTTFVVLPALLSFFEPKKSENRM